MESEKNSLDVSKLAQQDILDQKETSDAFVDRYLGLVKSVAFKIFNAKQAPAGVDSDDLVSWGVEGLLKAQKGYDNSLKTKFETYAYYRIRGEILDSIRKEWRHKNPKEFQEDRRKHQEQLADFISDSMDDSTESPKTTVHNAIEEAVFVRYLSKDVKDVVTMQKGMKNPEIEQVDETYDALWGEIKALTSIERQVMELFYVNGLKQFEIAALLKLSKSKVCRIHNKVLQDLKSRLKKEQELV